MPVPIVTIFGGSGFIGRQVAQRHGPRRLAGAGRGPPAERGELRPALRRGRPGRADPGQHPRRGLDAARAIAGADAVINCTGILAESRQADLRRRCSTKAPPASPGISAEEGVARLVHISAIGADPKSDSHYAAAKGRGEAAVRAAFPAAVILRPSIVFGADDSFFNRFGAMARILAGPAAGRPRDPLPAGLRQGRGRRRRDRRHHRRRPRRLRARRPRGGHLPRADAAAPAGSSSAGGCSSRSRSGWRRIQAWVFDLAPRLTGGLVEQQAPHPRPGPAARPRQRGLAARPRPRRPRRHADRDGRRARELPLRLPPARPVRRHDQTPPRTCARGPDAWSIIPTWSPPSSA